MRRSVSRGTPNSQAWSGKLSKKRSVVPRAFPVRSRSSIARRNLAEYAKFKGLRSEIQIQTILIHAWAETSHDITYKRFEGKGFGQRATASIEARLNKIMDEYLLPAGYEFQKVQHDFQRLM